MSKYTLNKLSLILLLLTPLVACVTEGQAETGVNKAEPTGLITQNRSIDWDRAGQDAQQNGVQDQKRSADADMAVPLLLPPSTLSISRASGPLAFAEPKILIDAKGYSAVIASKDFDMLIDASNQMIRTNDVATAEYPQDFDGKYQSIDMGSQLSIGRYGALYAIQFICTKGDSIDCMSERTAREIVQSLQVQLP